MLNLKVGSKITEIGKPAYSKSDIQGQYMGVLKIDRLLLIKLLKEYKNWVDSTSSESLNLKEETYISLISYSAISITVAKQFQL